MWPPCFLLAILILLSSSCFASGTDPLERILIQDRCEAEPDCKVLKRPEGEIELKFDNYPHFYHCAIIFVVQPRSHKVFLHILSEPNDCFGYRIRLYNDYVLVPSNELTPQTRNYCLQTDTNRTKSLLQHYPKSFITTTSYFTIQVEYKCREARFRPLDFILYYQHFTKEEQLYQDFCQQCTNQSYTFHPSICENLYENCSGLHQLRRANPSAIDPTVKKKGPSSTEIFGILLAGAIVLTILVVAFHCGGLPGAQGARGRGMQNGTGPGAGASHAFNTSTSYGNKGPVVHV
ncbi:uncharacterized protein [Amphiura filiformis]|uniref:uncharacterized protein n=1 Tax=Amphiura filiformis TaxID=82378 RepID=UPI003B2114E7